MIKTCFYLFSFSNNNIQMDIIQRRNVVGVIDWVMAWENANPTHFYHP